MAKLRKWTAYRKIERPYTRFSKVRGKAFVKSRPGKTVIKYDMGDLKGGQDHFPLVLKLISKDAAQIRTNAIEATRITMLKRLEGKLGRMGFYFKIKIVPHHAIRENPLAAGAGADRLSTGIKHSFGKIIGTASRVEVGKVIFELYLQKANELLGREILKLGSKKLPVKTSILSEFRKAKKMTAEQIEARNKAEEEAVKREEEAKLKAEAEAEKADAAKKAEEKTEETKQ